MDTKLMIVLIVVAAAAVLVALLFYTRRHRSMLLRDRFGPEYEKTVRESGSTGRAEAELEKRVQRVERLHLRPLPHSARRQYLARWMEIQRRFVDDPQGRSVSQMI